MPATFLYEAERFRYRQLPSSVPEGVLRQHSQLSQADQHLLRSDSPQADLKEVEETGGLLYNAPEMLSAYARQGRLA